MAVTNLRMLVKQMSDRGVDEVIARTGLEVKAFPAALALTVCVRYDGVLPSHQYVEASVETPSGAVADKSSAYTGKQLTVHGEVTLSVQLTAAEAGVYTVRATVDNRDVPAQKIAIRQSNRR